MTLSPDDPRPPYLQIADALRTAIRAGDYPPGSQIPSTNELAAEFGSARNTVRSAVRELADEGLLIPRHGSGVFVRSSIEPVERPSVESLSREVSALKNEISDLQQRMARLESVFS